MAYWVFDLLVLVLPCAVLRRGLPPGRVPAGPVLVLAAVALVWTGPWDAHLVRTEVWAYGPDRVLATLGGVPVEEHAFVVLMVLLVALWGTRTGVLTTPAGAAGPASARRSGALGWAAVALAGAVLLLAGGHARYLGLLLVWAAPPLALQRAVAGDLLHGRCRARALLVLPVALWLAAADRLALLDGVWTVAPSSSSGLLLAGLPVEEALFFLLTCLLVGDGLLLATDARALARLPRRRVASRA